MHPARLSPWICVIALLASYGCGSSQSGSATGSGANGSPAVEQAAAPKQEAPPPIIVPAGTSISVTVDQSVSSKDSEPGVLVAASLAEPVVVQGQDVIPRGAKVSGTVTNAKSAGRFKGNAELGITLSSVEIEGRKYTIHTSTFSEASKGR